MALNTFNVTLVPVIYPLTVKLPCKYPSPLILNPLSPPIPPATYSALAENELVLVKVLLILIWLVVTLPLSVTLCKLLVFQIVTLPVLVLTAVSVPAVIIVLDA